MNRHGHMAQLAKTSVRDFEFERPKVKRNDHFGILRTEYAKMAITIRLRIVKFDNHKANRFFSYTARGHSS